jgi:hypothetical protein
MINLLPLEKINEIKKEFKLKEILSFLSLTLFLLLIFFIFLFSFLYFLNYQIEKNNNEISKREADFKNTIEIQNKIKSFNNLLEKVNNFREKRFLISDFFEDFFTIFPQNDIYLKTINLQKKEDKNNLLILVQMTGVAKDRETIYSFRNTLKEKDNYQEVYFSPDSWFKANFPDFSLNFQAIKK